VPHPHRPEGEMEAVPVVAMACQTVVEAACKSWSTVGPKGRAAVYARFERVQGGSTQALMTWQLCAVYFLVLFFLFLISTRLNLITFSYDTRFTNGFFC
jgi:hypothetical protein